MQLILNGLRWAVLASFSGSALIWVPSAQAQDRCAIASDACIDRAETSFDSCYDRCENDACYTRCDGRYLRALATCESDQVACESGLSSSRPSAGSPPRPSMAQGNGCYLGECPDPEPAPTPPPGSPGTGSPQQPMVRPVRYSWICQTPAYWCASTNGAWPVGSPCWCSNPLFGNAYGQFVPQQ